MEHLMAKKMKWIWGWDEFLESLNSDKHKHAWGKPAKDIAESIEFLEVNVPQKGNKKTCEEMLQELEACEKDLKGIKSKNKAAESYWKSLKPIVNDAKKIMKKWPK